MPQSKTLNVFVSGTAQGIGAAIASHFLCNGHRVYGIDKRYKETIFSPQTPDLYVRHCELSNMHCVEAAIDEAASIMESPDIIINNAGYGGPFHRVDEVSNEEWERLFHINVKAPFQICRGFLPAMKAKGHGRIINIASIQSCVGAVGSSTYVACKHALLGYTRSIATEWGPHGIRCNSVSPGYVDTSMGIQESQISQHHKKVHAITPTASIASVDDIAKVVYFLGAESPDYVNGANWVVDGGILSSLS